MLDSGHGGLVKKITFLILAFVCFEVSADVKIGIEASRRGDYATAFSEFSIDASRDDAFAQNVLGTMYAQGIGVERDYKLALDWFFRAQALGSSEAMANLAKMYEGGIGIQQSNATALKYYREAAIDGLKPAVIRMAEIYERGELGVVLNKEVAQGWRARLQPAPDIVGPTHAEPVKAVARVVQSRQTSTATVISRKLPDSDKVVHLHAVNVSKLEQQLIERLEKYRLRERKLFIASTDKTPTIAAYLKEARARLARLLSNSFSGSPLEEGMIVSLSIRRDGSLSDVELNKGSGNSGINKRILSELREAKPFQVLPSAISKDIDVLVVTFRLPVE